MPTALQSKLRRGLHSVLKPHVIKVIGSENLLSHMADSSHGPKMNILAAVLGYRSEHDSPFLEYFSEHRKQSSLGHA